MSRQVGVGRSTLSLSKKVNHPGRYEQNLEIHFGIGKGGLYPPIERALLTIIAATAAKRFVVLADERLTAFVELEAAP